MYKRTSSIPSRYVPPHKDHKLFAIVYAVIYALLPLGVGKLV